jgi:hypothetical protein
MYFFLLEITFSKEIDKTIRILENTSFMSICQLIILSSKI